MSTFYTWVTDIIVRDPERASSIEADLKAIEKINGSNFTYARHIIGTNKDIVFFSGHSKNLGGGFYEWTVNDPIRMTWMDDEGGYGNNFE